MTERTCSIDDCDRSHYARTWCKPHYRRWLSHGDPLGGGFDRPRGLPRDVRFWAKVDRKGPDECWLWTGSPDDDGYGRFHLNNSLYAHRVAYELCVGPIPQGLELDHKCHTEAVARSECSGTACPHRRCVNPAHLEPVTHRENVRVGRLSAANAERGAGRTHCKHGHPFDEANTYIAPGDGKRHCRACRAETERRRPVLKALGL